MAQASNILSQFHNLPAGDLADRLGALKAEIDDLESRRKAIAAELIGRGVPHVEGALFEATVVAETMAAAVDRKAIEAKMGEARLARYLKWSKRSASVRIAPRAAAVARLAA